MIKFVLLLHFLMGAIFPFIAKRTMYAITQFKHAIDWLNNGFIPHQYYSNLKNKLLLWLVVSIGYMCLLAFVIHISMYVLYINY